MQEPTEPELEGSEGCDVETWLTAEEVAAECGLQGVPAVTRAYQRGLLGKERRKDRRGTKSVYVYDPIAVEEARAGGQLGTALAGEGVLAGAASNQLQANNLAIRMAEKLIEGVSVVIKAHEAQTATLSALAKSFLEQFERVDKRCAALEVAHLDFIKAKEELLNEESERDLQLLKFERSSDLRTKALDSLVTHAPALLELANHLVKVSDEPDEKAEKAE